MFTQSFIYSVNPPIVVAVGVAQVSWTMTAGAPTTLINQVYVNRALIWWGAGTSAAIPLPPTGVFRVDIGSVTEPAEEATSFANELPPAPLRNILVSWTGGTSESPNLVGFNVYLSPPNSPVVTTGKPTAVIPAFPGGSPVASGTWSWTTPSLYSGTYTVAVVAYDSAGNTSTVQQTTTVIQVPPPEPPVGPSGRRLTYIVLNPGEAPGVLPQIELNWVQDTGP